MHCEDYRYPKVVHSLKMYSFCSRCPSGPVSNVDDFAGHESTKEAGEVTPPQRVTMSKAVKRDGDDVPSDHVRLSAFRDCPKDFDGKRDSISIPSDVRLSFSSVFFKL